MKKVILIGGSIGLVLVLGLVVVSFFFLRPSAPPAQEGGQPVTVTDAQPEASGSPITGEEPAAPVLPATGEAAKLVLASLVAFNEAIQAKSFDAFHAGISKLWQEQITPAELLQIFQPFIDAGVDIKEIKTLEPVLAPAPEFNADGLLVLAGHYPRTPKKVYFTLKYITEGGQWKLAGLSVNVDD